MARDNHTARSITVSTPLRESVDRRKFDIAHLLISRGANLDTLDRHRESPLLKA